MSSGCNSALRRASVKARGSLIPDDGGSTHLWNIGRQSFYAAIYPRRQLWTSYLPPWELEISHNVPVLKSCCSQKYCCKVEAIGKFLCLGKTLFNLLKHGYCAATSWFKKHGFLHTPVNIQQSNIVWNTTNRLLYIIVCTFWRFSADNGSDHQMSSNHCSRYH
jgi:hypothetical protein